MIKKLFKTTGITTILTIAIALIIYSCNLGIVTAAQSEAQSEIKITFEPYIGPTEPLNPDAPNNLLTPLGQGTGAPGPLSIDYLPLLLMGISQQISTFEQTHPVISNQPFLQVTDLRGTGSGWSVRVELSDFVATDESTLPGASLVFYDGVPISPNMSALEPVVNNTITAFAGGIPVNVVTADAGSGKGTWLARWYDVPDSSQVGGIQLIIPGGIAHVGEYTAVIKWQLMDVE